jgi:hypothetical protein
MDRTSTFNVQPEDNIYWPGNDGRLERYMAEKSPVWSQRCLFTGRNIASNENESDDPATVAIEVLGFGFDSVLNDMANPL